MLELLTDTWTIVGMVLALVAATLARYGVRARVYRKRLVIEVVAAFAFRGKQVRLVSGAITLPFPYSPVCFVLYGRRANLVSDSYRSMRVHEWDHVDFWVEEGWRRYYRETAGWRIEHFLDDGRIDRADMLAVDSPVENRAYLRQAAFVAALLDAGGDVTKVEGHFPPVTK